MAPILTTLQVTLNADELAKLRRWARLPKGCTTTELANVLRATLQVATSKSKRMDGDDEPAAEPAEVST